MKDIATAFTFDLHDLDRSAWMARVEDIAEEFGDFEPIGMKNRALFIDSSQTLLVTFETVGKMRRNNDGSGPMGWNFVQSHGWSSLTLMSEADEDWFRHPAMFGYFDRLIDDGFFDDFETVLFYGAGAAGYAAAAFSVAAPEARVLAIQPQATLDTRLARWDRRFPEARKLDFSSRFGYAPMMVETAQAAYILHDPTVIEDGMHASLFNGENTSHFSCPNLGPEAERPLMAMKILPKVIEQAMLGTLDDLSFAKLWRARQSHMPYLRTLLHRLEAGDNHPRLLARLCRAVSVDGKRPLFAKKLAELEASGIEL